MPSLAKYFIHIFFGSFHRFSIPFKGDILGLLVRVSWISGSGPLSFELLMNLIKVSHFDHGKQNAKTAELLKNFAAKYDLEKYQYQSSIVADFQIAGYIKKHLIEENLETLAERLGVCNSHNHQNFFKKLLELLWQAIENNNCDCKLLIPFLIGK